LHAGQSHQFLLFVHVQIKFSTKYAALTSLRSAKSMGVAVANPAWHLYLLQASKQKEQKEQRAFDNFCFHC
jgi:hypothetical protein